MSRRFMLAVLFAIFSTGSASAQLLPERMKLVSGKSFVRAFLGMCAQNPGQYDRAVKMAKLLKFRNIPAKLKSIFGPMAADAEWKGYIVMEGDASPYFFGVSRAKSGSNLNVICAVSNPFIDISKVVSALSEFAELKQPIQDKKEMGQRYRLWPTESWSKDSYIFMTDSGPMGVDGVTLGFIAPNSE